MRAVLALGLVGCFAPSPQPGSTCANGACPAPLTCVPLTNTCERASSDAGLACTPADPACASNDYADGAIDVTAGGTFTADLARARDDVAPHGCGDDGGRDIYYSVTLNEPRVYYFATFGSSFDSVIRVFARPCSDVGGGADARACGDDACSAVQSQLAVSLPAGESCIVIDQKSAAESTGTVTLEVIAGVRDGIALERGTQMVSGDTRMMDNVMDPEDADCDAPGSGAKDVAYFFTSCPTERLLLDAETCTGATWDTVVYVRSHNDSQLACNDDACGELQSRITNAGLDGGPLFWLVVDGYDEVESGPFTLTTNLR